MTLDSMLERAARSNPDKVALIEINKQLTYLDFDNQVSALANGLLNLGIKPGDCVATLIPKSIEAVVAFMAIVRAGGIAAPINMRQKADALRVNFKQINPFAVIADPLYYPIINKFYEPIQPQGRVILTGTTITNGSISYENLIESESTRSPELKLKDTQIAYLNYTSGTTGIPKGAITTHENLTWNTKGAVETFKMNSEDVHLCMFSIYAHPHEIFCRSIYLGGTAVILDSMYPKTIARAIDEFKVTCVMAVPPFFRSLFPVVKSKRFDFSSLRIPEAGGVYSPPEFCQEFEDLFEKRFLPVWGSTETTGIALATPVDGDHRHGSLGKPVKGYEVQVLGAGGREASADETGELAISGPGVVQGYFNLPEDSERVFHTGVCRTGDMVRRDEDGFYYFLGRRSGLMKVAGMKVYPQELEQCLLKHPGIAEAAVVSLPDRLRGEIPKAFVSPKPGVELDENEIRAYCRENIADYKVPTQIQIFSELPKGEGGKIAYTELTQTAMDDLADSELKSMQRRIHSVDSKILDLLNARVELVQRIMSLRNKMDLPTYSAERSDEIIARVIEENKGPIYDAALEEIYKKILALDLMIQM
ncbi:MAG: AMP-binding protein [bacterium]